MVSPAPSPDTDAVTPRPARGRGGWTWMASLAVHVLVLGIAGEWALRSMNRVPSPALPKQAGAVAPLELPTMAEVTLASEEPRDPIGVTPTVSGGPTIARLDTGRDGHGGEPTVARAATHLADLDDRLSYSQALLNRLDRDQAARVRSQATRAAWEDRRSTTHPMDLSFLSSADLARLERRTVADHDPSRGVLASRPGSSPGSAPGASPWAGTEQAGIVGSAHPGTTSSAPGAGVRDGAPGIEHRTAAAVASARPDVARAPVSVEALARAKPKDNVDSEQELTSKVAALVHASTAGGLVAKAGVGGSTGNGAPGALGLSGAGSHPTPLGDGSSDWFDLSSTDPRLVAYFRHIHAKVDPLWAHAFPDSALLDLKQGTVILDVTIAADGTAQVAWPPARPSGVDEFDRNCADILRRASPFGPIPPELGLTRLHLRVPFDAKHPLTN